MFIVAHLSTIIGILYSNMYIIYICIYLSSWFHSIPKIVFKGNSVTAIVIDHTIENNKKKVYFKIQCTLLLLFATENEKIHMKETTNIKPTQ